MTEKKGLKDAYSLKTPEDSINLYKTWASTYDDDFAEIDKHQGDCIADSFSQPSSGRVGCNFGNEQAIPSHNGFLGRFIPDHYRLDSTSLSPACHSFNYMSQPFDLAYTISARNNQDEMTLKYHADYVKMDAINFSAEQLNRQNHVSIPGYDLNINSSGAARLVRPYKNEAFIYDGLFRCIYYLFSFFFRSVGVIGQR